MRNFETMTWGEILGRHHHGIAVNDIIEPAQNRLAQLGHDDQEELVSFRLGNTERIWAIRSGEEAFLLWWGSQSRDLPITPEAHVNARLSLENEDIYIFIL